MVTHVLRSAASRGLQQSGKNFTAKRSMGGGPKPVWTGIDKTVRGVFPEDYQLAGAILAGYGGLIGLFQLKSAFSSKPPAPAEAPAAAPSTAPSTDILPSVESPDFEKFLSSDAFGKFVESEDSLMKWVDSVAAE